MAIVKMNKFTLLTFNKYRDILVKELQKIQSVHFNDLKTTDMAKSELISRCISNESVSHCETELSKIKFLLEKILPFDDREKGFKALLAGRREIPYEEFDSIPDSFDYQHIYAAVKEKDEGLSAMKAQKGKLKAENEHLKNWSKLDVSTTELDTLKLTKYALGTISRMSYDSVKLTVEDEFAEAYIEQVGSIKDEISVLVLCPADTLTDILNRMKGLGFSRVNASFSDVPEKMIAKNNETAANIEKEEQSVKNSLADYKSSLESLEIADDYYRALLERAKACENFLKTDSVLIIEGWIPEERAEKLKVLINSVTKTEFYLEMEAVEKTSTDVPIALKNNKVVSAFEDVTAMYSLPLYNEVDPTPVLTPFYMMFFGLMLGDVGYGILLILLGTAGYKLKGLGQGTKNFLKFLFWLGFPTIIAGTLYGSLFGFGFFLPMTAENGNPKAILDFQLDIIFMMLMSVGFGLLHIIAGLCVKGYALLRDGRPFAAIFDSLFFIIAVLSGIILVAGTALDMPPAVSSIAAWAGIGSLVGIALTQGRESESLGGKIGSGLYAVYGMTGYMGDLVSYTRITALFLAGAYISFSFGIMQNLLPAGFPRIVFGTLVIIFGQAINFGLSLLGSYVHTLRLQYVEFFSKFYEGGGVPYAPLSINNKYINILNQEQEKQGGN